MKISIIYKHPIVRIGLTHFLQENFNDAFVSQFEDILAFQAHDHSQKPDLVIIGFSKEKNEIKLTAIDLLRKWNPANKIVVYEEETDQYIILEYFRNGIKGHLPKESAFNELSECITQVLDGKHHISGALLQLLLKKHPLTDADLVIANTDLVKRKTAPLTLREREIANYLSLGMKTSWIAQKLERKSSTISTIKYNIFKKLNVDNVVKLREAIQKHN